jgi:hypothetical protein
MLENIFSDKDKDSLPELPVSFVLASQKQLHVNNLHDTTKTWRYYSHHISRHPQDLRAHTQRLFLALDNDMPDVLAGATQDLFIALEGKGADLKANMLELVKPKLKSEDSSIFEAWLSSGTRKSFTEKQGSVLDKGLPGEPQTLVTVAHDKEEAAPTYGNAIEEANALLEYGQVEEAQTLLEEDLLRSNDEEVMVELLNIYQYTRDKTSLEATAGKLLESGVELSDAWKEVQNESQEWE